MGSYPFDEDQQDVGQETTFNMFQLFQQVEKQNFRGLLTTPDPELYRAEN